MSMESDHQPRERTPRERFADAIKDITGLLDVITFQEDLDHRNPHQKILVLPNHTLPRLQEWYTENKSVVDLAKQARERCRDRKDPYSPDILLAFEDCALSGLGKLTVHNVIHSSPRVIKPENEP